MPPFHGRVRKRVVALGDNDEAAEPVASPNSSTSTRFSSSSNEPTSSSLIVIPSSQALSTPVPSSTIASSSSSAQSPKRSTFPSSPLAADAVPGGGRVTSLPSSTLSIASSSVGQPPSTTLPNINSSTSQSQLSTASSPAPSSPTTSPISYASSSAVPNATRTQDPGPSNLQTSASASPTTLPETSASSSSPVSPTAVAASDQSPSSNSAPSASATVFTSATTITTSSTTFTSDVRITSTSLIPTPAPAEATIAASHTSNGTKTAILAGVIGGLGGLILFIMLGFFLCVRWRRRQHAQPLDWEAVRTSGLFRSISGPPRTPRSARSFRSIRSARTATPGPTSPQMSQISHTTSQSHSQYATAPNSATSPIRNGGQPGTARTNISPLLMVQTPPRSEESYHGHDGEYDPFADPLAMARMRPRLSDMSPTIRVSDTTLVDQAWGPGKGMPSKNDGLAGGPASQPVRGSHNELLMPPPSLSPMTGRSNRLSNDSLPPPPQEDAGLAM